MTPLILKNKFGAMGVLSGRTKADIIAQVGPPNSVSAAEGGKMILQWIESAAAGAHHFELLFDANDTCEAVTHEFDGTN